MTFWKRKKKVESGFSKIQHEMVRLLMMEPFRSLPYQHLLAKILGAGLTDSKMRVHMNRSQLQHFGYLFYGKIASGESWVFLTEKGAVLSERLAKEEGEC